jgi:S-DNA-T family DNA segregation ATPase FtsK/SpoIIIE
MIIKTNSASISKLQRAFGIGYPRAGKIIDQMERMNMISEADKKNARTIFITQQEFEERFGEEL